MKSPSKLLTILLLLVVAGTGYGQAVVLSASSTNGIEYAAHDGPTVRVFAGQSIPIDGRLKLAAGRSLDLVYGGKKIRLEGPTQFDLADLAAAAKAEKGNSFIGRFLEFLSASVTNTGTAQDVEDYHRKYMTNTKAGLKGWAKGDGTIWVAGYFRFVVDSDPTPLRWDSVAGADSYQVQILDADSGEVILGATAKENQLSIPLSELPLHPEKSYQLRIAAEGKLGKVMTPEDVYFRFDPAAVQSFRKQIAANRTYKNLSPEERKLYLAHRLEREGYLHAAREDYEALLATDPTNKLYRKVYAAFLIRLNEMEAANAVLAKVRADE